MKTTVIIISFLLSALSAAAQLRFDHNGEFKIVQFTDLHINAYKAESNIAFERMKDVIASEKPDLIVITGDIVYSSPADKPLKKVMDCISSYNIPFCTVFGNHDSDFGMSRDELAAIIKSYPNCLLPSSRSEDYVLEILSSGKTSDSKPAALLYCLDSNAHLWNVDGKFAGYDSIHPFQVQWYRQQSTSFTEANGGKPVPALMFFHIPLPEYRMASETDGNVLVGTRMEPVCCPGENTGMFDAILQCGDVMATFVGHDHDNDYLTMKDGVALVYGRFTGGKTEYTNIPNGARVIILKEGKRGFETYCRLRGGQIIDRVSYLSSHISFDQSTLRP